MKRFFVISCLLSAPSLLGNCTPPTTWDLIRTAAYDDLGKAEYYLDKYEHPPTDLKDKIWVLLRNGFRQTNQLYAANKKKYGTPTPNNAVDIMAANFDAQSRWARIYSKAVAKNIKPVISDDLEGIYNKNRLYQKELRDQAHAYRHFEIPEEIKAEEA